MEARTDDLQINRGVLERFGNNQRRLSLLQRMGLFSSRLAGAEITRAVTLEDLRQAFGLTHDTFVASGYIEPLPGGLRIRHYEATGATATFIARKEGRIVAVLGLVVDSPDVGLPSDTSFGGELDALRAQGLKLAEGTNQAVVSEFRNTAVTTELMRCGVAQTMLHDCDAIIVTVSPGHAHFYQIMGFHQVGQERSYSKTVYDPVVMMYMSTRTTRQEVKDDPSQHFTRDFLFWSNPYHQNARNWQQAADHSYRSADLLRELFVTSSDFLSRCSAAQRQVIRRRWGEALYNQVIGRPSAPALAAPAELDQAAGGEGLALGT